MIQDFTLKAQLAPPLNPERVVRPRKNARVGMPIVVCDSQMRVWYENDKSKKSLNLDWDIVELIRYLRDNWPRDRDGKRRTTPIMLVCHNPHKVLLRVHEAFKNDPDWQIRLSVNASERFHLDGTVREAKTKTTKDLRVSLFGFSDSNRKTKYFHILTPFDFFDDFKEYGDPDWPEYVRLYHWGGSVRKWMRKNKLRFTSTRGGLAAQLLRDKRFYPEKRRKVPRQTNEKARPALPGNFYAMIDGQVDRLHKGVYVIDQENAHHHAAENVLLPNANDLFARGRFISLSDEPYVKERSIGFNNLIGELGLFRCRVHVPNNLLGMLPPWMEQPGLTDIFLYSNELDLVKEMGVEIRHISYAWTSRERDTGLNKYAQWAQQEVTKNPKHKLWLKPTLLAAYGILGARPRHMEVAYWQADTGEPHRYLLGPIPIMMQKYRTKKEIQPAIANIIHRGMIEAETRKLSVQLARKLENEGHTVIAIHADALLVRDEGQQFPLLPPPWRIKDRLNMFKAVDLVSFESDTMTILPGRKRAKR